MKELRSFGGHLRALFALDPKRRAIVLLGGDKRGDWTGWYERNIPIAGDLSDEHVRSLDTRTEPMARTLSDIRAKRPLSPDARMRIDDIKRA